MKFEKKLTGVVLISSLFIFSSCDNKLSREKAKELIIQKYNLPYDDVSPIELNVEKSIKFTASNKNSHNEITKEDILARLEQGGFITYTIDRVSSEVIDETWWSGGIGYDSQIDFFTKQIDLSRVLVYTIQETYNHVGKLTEKGKQYLINGNSFKVGKTEFGLVTGTVESKGLNITEVTYSLVYSPNELGSQVFNLQGATKEMSESFRKYDDGWRINK